MDHGYPVDNNKRCKSRTKKERQCALQAIAGIDFCALHAGLALARGKPGYGDPKALEAYKRRLVARPVAATARPAGRI
ncbi:MAG TPA: hypothetical protein VI789_08405 [Dehalococcoidia bacterium]|nr:hypothetical protein [Dehalococcoidia bacterium]